QVAHEVIEILYKYKHNLKIQWDSFDTYYSNNLLPFETDYIEAYKSEYPDENFNMKVIESVEDNLHMIHNEDIYQIFTYSMEKDMRAYQDIIEKLSKFRDIHYVDFKEHYTDITHIDVNKGAAIKKVAGLNKIKSEQIIAFGDNHNDRTMLEYAGISVAMKNANEEIRSISKHMALTNNEEGVEKFLREYFSI
ncbi:MAG: HAD-IIB family hydrolase, partial [Eubacteriaceae bacterium]|nr:HAD-IIB family hydrolase [Eubacteriaceae bacterium]